MLAGALGLKVQVIGPMSDKCGTHVVKHNQLISSHGYGRNGLTLWDTYKYHDEDSCTLKELTFIPGHGQRVLYTGLTQNDLLCSAGDDEMVWLWKPWKEEKAVRRLKQPTHDLQLRACMR